MSNSEHEVSIPDNSLLYSSIANSNSTETQVLSHTCEAREYGEVCLSDATQTYTPPGDISHRLCDYHFYRLLRLIRVWHRLREETAKREEAS
jgi:hypothetical protein